MSSLSASPVKLRAPRSPLRRGAVVQRARRARSTHIVAAAGVPPEALNKAGVPPEALNKVVFRCQQQIGFGQYLKVVGASDALGNWDVHEAPTMEWSEGDKWEAELDMPRNGEFEFKLALIHEDGSAFWEEGDNRMLAVDEQTPGKHEVACTWMNTTETVVSVVEAVEVKESAAAAVSAMEATEEVKEQPPEEQPALKAEAEAEAEAEAGVVQPFFPTATQSFFTAPQTSEDAPAATAAETQAAPAPPAPVAEDVPRKVEPFFPVASPAAGAAAAVEPPQPPAQKEEDARAAPKPFFPTASEFLKPFFGAGERKQEEAAQAAQDNTAPEPFFPTAAADDTPVREAAAEDTAAAEVPRAAGRLVVGAGRAVVAAAFVDVITPTRVAFKCTQALSFGERLAVVGAGDVLGNWDAYTAPAMEWSEGHKWCAEVELPCGEVEFKLVILNEDGAAFWEEGPNRTIAVEELGPNRIQEAVCAWMDTSATDSTVESMDEDDFMSCIDDSDADEAPASAPASFFAPAAASTTVRAPAGEYMQERTRETADNETRTITRTQTFTHTTTRTSSQSQG